MVITGQTSARTTQTSQHLVLPTHLSLPLVTYPLTLLAMVVVHNKLVLKFYSFEVFLFLRHFILNERQILVRKGGNGIGKLQNQLQTQITCRSTMAQLVKTCVLLLQLVTDQKM